jgi:DNA mismatch repair ATPase MutS
MYDKEIFVKDYFKIHKCYASIYGLDKTIILMQVGSFHEAYCNDDNGLDLVTLAQKLDVVCTKKNGNKELSDSNPRMMGFPVHVTHNFIEKLINLNYTVVLIDQTTEPPEPKREITGIYSPATYLEKNNSKNCNLVSIVIDKTKTKVNDQLCIGLCSYDLSTGNGFTFETYSTTSDELLALDETLRFLDTVKPREILLINKIKEPIANMKPNEIVQYLQLDEKILYNFKIENQEKIKYQQRLLETIFPFTNNLSVFENLNLSFTNLEYSHNVVVGSLFTCSFTNFYISGVIFMCFSI